MRPARNIHIDGSAFLVHWMKLQFDLPVFGIEQNDPIAIQPVAGSPHGDFVPESIMEFTGIFRGSWFAIFTRFKWFPFAAGSG